MLTQYRMQLKNLGRERPDPTWSYLLYAALLEQSAAEWGDRFHREGTTPVSQSLSVKGDKVFWTVNFLGNSCERAMAPTMENVETLFLQKKRTTLEVIGRRKEEVQSVEDLFTRAAAEEGKHHLIVDTPAAFKQQGQYRALPTLRLIVQSLIGKWNGSIAECPIEDADGAGMDAIVEGLRITDFNLMSQNYKLKGIMIPGFVGEFTIENHLTGFRREFADALLLFSNYSGIGIKTSLGMGGVRHR